MYVKGAVLRIAILAAVGLSILPSTAYQADKTMDRAYVSNQLYTNYFGSMDKTRGGLEAWNMVPVLHDDINLFDATGDTEWLDDFIDKSDQIIAAAVDGDGDGVKEWGDGRYSHNQVKNGNFAAGVIGAVYGAAELLTNSSFESGLTGWNQEGNTSSSYTSTSAGDAFAGLAGGIIESDGINANRLVQQLSYTGNNRYVVEAYAGVDNTKTQGKIEIFNATTNTVLATQLIAHMGYERYTFNFTAPASGSTLQLRLGLVDNSKTGYKIKFDAVSVKQVSGEPGELVANGTFESTNPGDSTLPAQWTRFQGNASTVYSAIGINKAYDGARGLAITNDNTMWHRLEQTIAYTPSTSYVVSFNGRVTDSRFPGKVEVYNVTDATVMGVYSFSSTTYGKYRFGFTAPATAGKTIQLRIYADSYTNFGTTYVDNVSIKGLQQKEIAAWSTNRTYLSSVAVSGSNANWTAEMIPNGVSVPQMTQTMLNYKPNTLYQTIVSAKGSPGASALVQVYDETTSTVLGSATIANSDTFRDTSFDFMTPASGHTLRFDVSMPSGASGQRMYINSVSASQKMGYQVHDGLIGAALLRFANAVYANPVLSSSYVLKADAYKDFVAAELFHKWDGQWHQITGVDGSDNGTGVYTFPTGFTDETFSGRSLPHNQYLAYAWMLYQLYDATEGDPSYAVERHLYLSRANDLERTFRSKLLDNPRNASAYVWWYWNNLGSWDDGHYYTNHSEDLGHSGLTARGALEAYLHGQVFTLAEIQKLTKTFTEVMYNQYLYVPGITEPSIASSNDKTPTSTSERVGTSGYGYWADFAAIDPKVAIINQAVVFGYSLDEQSVRVYFASRRGSGAEDSIAACQLHRVKRRGLL